MMNRIVVDAMGGDYAPEEIVKGAAAACRESSTIYCIFVGDEKRIRRLLKKEKIKPDRWEIVHTEDVISMRDAPKDAVVEKPKASINVAARLIGEGKGEALVSAGNTGATIMAASKHIPRMPGIERGVLVAIFPSVKENADAPGVTIMLDVGATLHCTVNQLISFAIMGIHYAREVLAIERPRVGLLNIGEEETKGHNVLVETNQALRNMAQVNFIGNVEGKDIMRGTVDVIITEGLVGNIVLKSLEGMAELLFRTGKQIWKKNLLSKMGITMLAPTLKRLKKRVDYSEYGGAPVLGFQKLIIKAHGRSSAKAIKNAVLLAEKSIVKNLVKHMEFSMKEYYLSMFDQHETNEN